MPYSQVDMLIQKLDPLVSSGSVDPFLESHFAALVAVVGTAAFERRIKQVLIEFCHNQNVKFGLYVENTLRRIKGRISIQDLKGEYLGKFGKPFVDKFIEELEKLKENALVKSQPNPSESYDSLINARHKFVHENMLLLNYKEAKEFFLLGIEIIYALERTVNG